MEHENLIWNNLVFAIQSPATTWVVIIIGYNEIFVDVRNTKFQGELLPVIFQELITKTAANCCSQSQVLKFISFKRTISVYK